MKQLTREFVEIAESWFNRGVALYELGQFEEAIASYDKAIKIKSDHYKAWNSRGIALGNLGRLKEAIASFDQAIEIKPDYDEASSNRWLTHIYSIGEQSLQCHLNDIKVDK